MDAVDSVNKDNFRQVTSHWIEKAREAATKATQQVHKM